MTTALVATDPAPVAARSRATADLALERRTLRRLLDEATGLVAGVVPGHVDRAALLGAHVRHVVTLIEQHELAVVRAGPPVARRDARAAAAISRIRHLRGDVDVRLSRLSLALPYWERGASAVCRDTVWEVLVELGLALEALSAAEERDLLPLVLDGDVPPRAALGPWTGHLLETLTASAGRAWRSERMTPAERVRWRLLDGPRFHRTRRRVRG